MRFVRGFHKKASRWAREHQGLKDDYAHAAGINHMDKHDPKLKAAIVAVNLKPGDILIFDGRIPHGPSKPPKVDIRSLVVSCYIGYLLIASCTQNFDQDA